MQISSNDKPKFFVDAMLGNISKKLRLLGYDTKYSHDVQDDQLLELAKNEKRIIVTKDLELINRLKKTKEKFIFITKDSEIEQFIQISDFIKPKKLEITGDKSRCTKCNSQTISIDKKNISDRIPSKVLDHNEKFWKCKNCGQIYWEGTHIKKLQKFVNDLNERL